MAGHVREVVVVGDGLAGLSAAIYLGRARRDVLVVGAGRSMAVWEPEVENYLGFPEGISGEGLIERGLEQARRFGAEIVEDTIRDLAGKCGHFMLCGERGSYRARRVLVATGITHLPPDVPGVRECLGHSLFFCKDCDGYRVRGKAIAIVGANNEAVEYALGMLPYSPQVFIATNGELPRWDDRHGAWLAEYQVPFHTGRIEKIAHEGRQITALCMEGGRELGTDFLFTTRGDSYHNGLAVGLGAAVDADGQVIVDECLQTSVRGLYAAGCVTPANCQMIIAAGQGAIAAQAINRDLFDESLATHSLRRFRAVQLELKKTTPDIVN